MTCENLTDIIPANTASAIETLPDAALLVLTTDPASICKPRVCSHGMSGSRHAYVLRYRFSSAPNVYRTIHLGAMRKDEVERLKHFIDLVRSPEDIAIVDRPLLISEERLRHAQMTFNLALGTYRLAAMRCGFNPHGRALRRNTRVRYGSNPLVPYDATAEFYDQLLDAFDDAAVRLERSLCHLVFVTMSLLHHYAVKAECRDVEMPRPERMKRYERALQSQFRYFDMIDASRIIIVNEQIKLTKQDAA